jgi:hypothetical protein
MAAAFEAFALGSPIKSSAASEYAKKLAALPSVVTTASADGRPQWCFSGAKPRKARKPRKRQQPPCREPRNNFQHISDSSQNISKLIPSHSKKSPYYVTIGDLDSQITVLESSGASEPRFDITKSRLSRPLHITNDWEAPLPQFMQPRLVTGKKIKAWAAPHPQGNPVPDYHTGEDDAIEFFSAKWATPSSKRNTGHKNVKNNRKTMTIANSTSPGKRAVKAGGTLTMQKSTRVANTPRLKKQQPRKTADAIQAEVVERLRKDKVRERWYTCIRKFHYIAMIENGQKRQKMLVRFLCMVERAIGRVMKGEVPDEIQTNIRALDRFNRGSPKRRNSKLSTNSTINWNGAKVLVRISATENSETDSLEVFWIDLIMHAVRSKLKHCHVFHRIVRSCTSSSSSSKKSCFSSQRTRVCITSLGLMRSNGSAW